jgi:hypothetical protein
MSFKYRLLGVEMLFQLCQPSANAYKTASVQLWIWQPTMVMYSYGHTWLVGWRCAGLIERGTLHTSTIVMIVMIVVM